MPEYRILRKACDSQEFPRSTANSSLKCNTCSKLMVQANLEIQTSMTESISRKRLKEEPILTNPALHSGSLDQGVALHF
jgi:hypothetical protein